MSKLIGICGLGVFGSSLAKSLSLLGAEVIAIDGDIKNVERLDEYLTQGIQGDFSDFQTLKAAGFGDCDLVFIAASTNLEAGILALLNLQQLGVQEIMVKAKNKPDMRVYQRLGASRIIRPEKEMGERIAKEILQNKVLESLEIDDNYSVIEFIVPMRWIGKTLIQLELRSRFDMNVLGIKKDATDKMNVNIDVHYKFEEGDILIVLASTKKFEKIELDHN